MHKLNPILLIDYVVDKTRGEVVIYFDEDLRHLSVVTTFNTQSRHQMISIHFSNKSDHFVHNFQGTLLHFKTERTTLIKHKKQQ